MANFIQRMFGAESREVATLRGRVARMEEQRAIMEVPWNVGAISTSTTPSPQQALRLAPVYAAVSLIARSISTLPLHAYRTTREGDTKRMPFLPQLFQAPSIHGELTDWLHRLLSSLLLTGNAYGLITARDGFGYPVMIEWLDPAQVQVLDQSFWGRGSYWDPVYYWRGRVIDKQQLVHIPWFAIPFRVKGMSPLEALATTIDVGLEGQRYSQDWYKAGGVPPGTFKNSEDEVEQVEAQNIKARLVSSIQSHQPIVYGRQWDYKPIAITPQDAAFVQTHQLSATDIAIAYGIYPVERIGGAAGKSMTYSNVEAEQIQWANLTLMPYVQKLESYFYDLLPQPQYVKFNLDASIRTDTKTRHEIYQIDREIGLHNIDEIREKEDLAPLPNGQGQDYNPLIAVRELIRSAAITTGNPNAPGFQAGEPVPAGAAGSPGAGPVGSNPAQPNGRFVGQPGELQPVGRALPPHGEEDDDEDGHRLPPF